ncbi:MAG TPA: plasmid stabilization protein [Azoarcus taiwanensis]|nr:plasmid stabilization protein [Azoarcus taiwanensis]
MAALTIRNVDDATKAALRIRAAQHGVSMEEEARRILREALSRAGTPTQLGQRLLERFAVVASDDFELPQRQPPRTPPDWDAPA